MAFFGPFLFLFHLLFSFRTTDGTLHPYMRQCSRLFKFLQFGFSFRVWLQPLRTAISDRTFHPKLDQKESTKEAKSGKDVRFRALSPHHRVRQNDSTGNRLGHMLGPLRLLAWWAAW